MRTLSMIFAVLISTAFSLSSNVTRAAAAAAEKSAEHAADPAVANQVAATVKQNLSSLSRCYQVIARQHPGVTVTVSVTFEIAADGHVPTAKVVKTDHKDGLFESCVVDSIRSWPFAAPPGGGLLSVTYPLVFASATDITVPDEDEPATRRSGHAKRGAQKIKSKGGEL